MFQKITKTIYRILIPSFIERGADPEKESLRKFIETVAAKEIRAKERMLDAGAGFKRYEGFFKHAIYESTDFEDIFNKDFKNKHTFVCSLDNIPVADNTYDAIINNQVLEHVKYPKKVLEELFRILKPGGKIFVTVPQISHVHGAPYNFFFFTNFGLELLLKETGFRIISIKPRGGIFFVIAKWMNVFSDYLFYQHVFNGWKRNISFKPEKTGRVKFYLLFPFYFISRIVIGEWGAYCVSKLDFLDKQKNFTLGYSVYCIKP
ncbi:MAG: methyltransferase domain-containing protein [Candidatus Harrisonbacteria bacterium]|nr:methyltransferase domain-containing protein [Candidatus Harrisonbacteria bacterium]